MLSSPEDEYTWKSQDQDQDAAGSQDTAIATSASGVEMPRDTVKKPRPKIVSTAYPPPRRPAHPTFTLSESATDEEVETFWKDYPKTVNEYNAYTVCYWRKTGWYRTSGTGRTDYCNSTFLNNTHWESKEVEMSRTLFETQKLKLVRSNFPESEWFNPVEPFKSEHFDLSGPLGEVCYKKSETAKDQLDITSDGSYNYQGIVFKLSFFNFVEKAPKYKDMMCSGYRIRLSMKGVMSDDYFVVAERVDGQTKVSLKFTYKYIPRVVVFILPEQVDPERVNTYPIENTEGEDDIYTDIPFTPVAITRVKDKLYEITINSTAGCSEEMTEKYSHIVKKEEIELNPI